MTCQNFGVVSNNYKLICGFYLHVEVALNVASGVGPYRYELFGPGGYYIDSGFINALSWQWNVPNGTGTGNYYMVITQQNAGNSCAVTLTPVSYGNELDNGSSPFLVQANPSGDCANDGYIIMGVRGPTNHNGYLELWQGTTLISASGPVAAGNTVTFSNLSPGTYQVREYRIYDVLDPRYNQQSDCWDTLDVTIGGSPCSLRATDCSDPLYIVNAIDSTGLLSLVGKVIFAPIFLGQSLYLAARCWLIEQTSGSPVFNIPYYDGPFLTCPECTLCGVTISESHTDNICGRLGSITINPSGGTAPYTFSWTSTNGFTSASQNIINLQGGIYTLTITDSIGCSAVAATIEIRNINTNCGTCYSLSLCDGSRGPVILNNPTFSGPLGTDPPDYVGRCFYATMNLIGASDPIVGCFCLSNIDCNSNSVLGALVDVDEVFNECGDCQAGPCWLLTNCQDPNEFYTVSSDLTALEGKVINHVVIRASPSPDIAATKCFTVAPADPCRTTDTLDSYGTAYPDCSCCIPSNESPQPPPPKVIPAPVKIFFEVKESLCDIEIKQKFGSAYWNYVKQLRYGVTSCCQTDLESLWLDNEISELTLLNIPGFCTVRPPNSCCCNNSPCCHAWNGCSWI